jgi:hypothetical protein
MAVSAQPSNLDSSLPDAPSVARLADSAGGGPVSRPQPAATAIIRTEVPESPRFAWQTATRQSMTMLMFQHAARMAQPKTREMMGGPFFHDYAKSITNISGWEDGDGMLTNYVAHPMMGAITGYVEVQNDREGIDQEFGASPRYWNSRLRAMAFAAAYSTQFEIGPLSEAAIGNVGLKKGTSGWVDFIMTPTGGFGLMLAEDALDRHVISKWEVGSSPPHRRVYRMLLNPSRSIANLLRRKVPWHRDTRPMFPAPEEAEMTVTAGGN